MYQYQPTKRMKKRHIVAIRVYSKQVLIRQQQETLAINISNEHEKAKHQNLTKRLGNFRMNKAGRGKVREELLILRKTLCDTNTLQIICRYSILRCHAFHLWNLRSLVRIICTGLSTRKRTLFTTRPYLTLCFVIDLSYS